MITELAITVELAEADNEDTASAVASAEIIKSARLVNEAKPSISAEDSATRKPFELDAALAERDAVEIRIFSELARTAEIGDADASARAIRSASADASDVQDSTAESWWIFSAFVTNAETG